MNPSKRCVFCMRPFPTQIELDRHKGLECPEPEAEHWCNEFCWRQWGSVCHWYTEATASDEALEAFIAGLRDQIPRAGTQPRWVDFARAIAKANGLSEPTEDEVAWVLWERTPYPLGGFESVIAGLVHFYASEEARS